MRFRRASSGALRESLTLRVIGWHRIDDRASGLSTPLANFESHLAILEQWGACIVRLEEGVAGLRMARCRNAL